MYLLIYLLCMCMLPLHMCGSEHVEVRGLLCGSWFSLSPISVPEIKLRVSSLVVNTFTPKLSSQFGLSIF